MKNNKLTKEEQDKLNNLLPIAVAKADLEKVKDLLKQGANPNIKITFDYDPIHTRKHFPDLHYRDVQTRVAVETYPVTMAVGTGDIEIVKALIKAGANTEVSETLFNRKTNTVKRCMGLRQLLPKAGYELSKNGKKIRVNTEYSELEQENTLEA